MNIGDQLKKFRMDVKLSQAQVGAALGFTSSQAVSNWELDKAFIPMGRAAKLSKLYKIKPAVLLSLGLARYEAIFRKKMNG